MKETKDLSKENSPRSATRLLWFLLVPLMLGGSAFFAIQARQQQGQQLQAMTQSLAIQPVRVVHAEQWQSKLGSYVAGDDPGIVAVARLCAR